MTTHDAGMNEEARVPAALDDPTTQEAVQLTSKTLWLRCLKRVGASVLIIVVVLLLGIDWLAVLAIAAFFAGMMFAIMHCQSLFWLGRVKRVLRVYPWSPGAHVRKLRAYPGQKATAVIRMHMGDEDWSSALLARNVHSAIRWEKELEDEAWFAGDIAFGGVVARPGSGGLTFVHPQFMDELSGEREAASDDRKERARAAKLGKRMM